ncbi:MAG: VCBS repeat-containing protein [Pseudomonadota bacterium]
MLKIINILFFCLALFQCSSSLASSIEHTIISPDWKSQKFPNTFWGMDLANVDSDKATEIILLERNALHIAEFEKDKIKITNSITWKSYLNAVRVFAMDLDGDGVEEIIISAVQDGIPASFVLKLKEGKLEYLFKNIKWHLRVIEKSQETEVQKILIGQSLNSADFFEGNVYEFAYENDKLKRGDELKLPWQVNIFNFAFLPNQDVAVLKGYAPLKVYNWLEKRYKKVWTSGERLGGTLNVVEAKEREPLGIAKDGQVAIDKEPEVYERGDQLFILAPKHGLPLKNMIGRYPYVRNGQIVGFKNDESLGFMTSFTTQEMPGFIADFALQQISAKKTRLFLLVQPDTSAFYQYRESVILAYDL